MATRGTRLILAGAVGGLAVCIRVHGAVVATTGTVAVETAPYPAPSDETIFVFDEQQGVPFVSSQPLNAGEIAPGTCVNSHYVQFDPESPTGIIGTGTITFDGPILGVITSTANLTADLDPDVDASSDEYFGLETSLGPYPTGADPAARGLGSAEDDLIFTIGQTTLTIESLEIPVPGNLDGFRVLTGCVETCIGDLDGSGDVGFADLLEVLSAWGPCGECAQDLDDDGIVGFGDVLVVLANWGPCD